MENPVDGAGAGWVSIADLARRKGVSKQAIHKTVGRLVEQGLLSTKQGLGGSKLVELAAFERVVSATTDAVRSANGKASTDEPSTVNLAPSTVNLEPRLPVAPPGIPDAPKLAEQQARRAAINAERDLIKLDIERNASVAVEEILAAVATCGEAIARSVDQLPSRADEVLAAAAGGLHGVRAKLKDVAFDLRASMESALRKLAASTEAPGGEPANEA